LKSVSWCDKIRLYEQFFALIDLATRLKTLKIDVTAIIKGNQQEIPKFLKTTKVKKGEIEISKRESDGLTVARYHDKKELTNYNHF